MKFMLEVSRKKVSHRQIALLDQINFPGIVSELGRRLADPPANIVTSTKQEDHRSWHFIHYWGEDEMCSHFVELECLNQVQPTPLGNISRLAFLLIRQKYQDICKCCVVVFEFKGDLNSEQKVEEAKGLQSSRN
uniref:Uncharacterized protein n=1 Tax=Molossus molossus TaxID=27622 RepID=A0A7J8JV82_MOLMO|nr:hypothetical protein HJG59_007812 [Molossus molossus]